jgi:hypothetical protein
MKVYKGFLTGIAALALLFSGLSGCETPTGDTGPRGADALNYLTIESDVTVVAPGSTGNVFTAMFKGDDVSHNTLTKWEVSGDGMYANYPGPGTPIDGHHPDTDFARTGGIMDYALGGGVMLTVDAAEQAANLQVTATHGGYSASWQLTTGARGLEFIRLIPGITDGTTKIDLHQPDNGVQKTVLTQPDFGYYFVWEKSDAPALNVLKTKQVNVQNTVNEAEEILVKNGDWINIYEVPQNDLTNETVHGYVSLQVHASTSDVKPFPNPLVSEQIDGEKHNILVPNLYEPAEYLTMFLDTPTTNTVLDIADPLTGTSAVVTRGANYAALFEGNYRAYAIDQVTWKSKTFKRDAALVTSGAVEVTGDLVNLPTVGEWHLVVQHIASGAWWEIDTATVKHTGYVKGWIKKPEENILTITVSGGKKLTDWQQIAVNGIPFTLKPEGWDDTYAKDYGYTTVTLLLGDLDMSAPAAGSVPNPETLFVSGSGGGVSVSIPASHFMIGTTPVSPKTDDDVQVIWGIDSTIRGRVVTGGVNPPDDDENSWVQVIDTFTGADISSHYTFRWYYVSGKDWTDAPEYTGEGSYGQQGSTYHGGNVESAAKKYLGLKVIPQSGYAVRTDSEFVFGAFID